MKEKKRQRYLEILNSHILFRHLGEQNLDALLNDFQEEKWTKNTISVSRTHTLYRFYIIFSGRIKVYKIDPFTGREFTLFLLTKNDFFDILCLLDEAEHHVYHQPLDDTVILSVPMSKMREWLKSHPEMNKALLPYLMNRMRIVEEYASNITLIDISTRLAMLILKNINQKSQKLELINDLSHEEIANLIGTTRAVVNRHLQEFKEVGILNVGRKKMEIQNLQLLIDKIENRDTKYNG